MMGFCVCVSEHQPRRTAFTIGNGKGRATMIKLYEVAQSDTTE